MELYLRPRDRVSVAHRAQVLICLCSCLCFRLDFSLDIPPSIATSEICVPILAYSAGLSLAPSIHQRSVVTRTYEDLPTHVFMPQIERHLAFFTNPKSSLSPSGTLFTSFFQWAPIFSSSPATLPHSLVSFLYLGPSRQRTSRYPAYVYGLLKAASFLVLEPTSGTTALL